MSFESLKLF